MTAPQQTIVKAAGSAEFLRLVPHLVGVSPIEHSVVLVPFAGKRTTGALRVDLPAGQSDTALKRIANTLVGMVCKVPNVSRIAVVVYTDAPIGDDLPHRDVAARLSRRARAAGLEIVDLLVVAGTGWGSYLDDRVPSGGHPLNDIEGPQTLAGRTPTNTVAATTLEAVPQAQAAAFADTVRDVETKAEALIALRDPQLCDRIETMLSSGASRESAALLAVLARRPALRDLALLQFAWGPAFGRYVHARTIVTREPLTERDAAGLAFAGAYSVPPNATRINTAIELARFAAAHLPSGQRAPVLTMLSWLHWALGHGTIASRFMDLALLEDPELGLAALMAVLLDAAVLPDWAFRAGSQRLNATG